MNPEKLKSLVAELFEEVRSWREHMHRHPEPSFQEKTPCYLFLKFFLAMG